MRHSKRVLFRPAFKLVGQLLAAKRYEQRSLLISSNSVFSQWDQIFKDPMTTMAAIDRLVHHHPHSR